MGTGLTIVAILLLVLMAALLTMAQTAIDRVSRGKAHHLVQEKKKGSQYLLKIVEDPARYMNVMWLLTLVAQVTAAVLATGLAIDAFSGAGEVVAAVAVTVVLYVVAVLPPKAIAVQHTDRCACLVAAQHLSPR